MTPADGRQVRHAPMLADRSRAPMKAGVAVPGLDQAARLRQLIDRSTPSPAPVVDRSAATRPRALRTVPVVAVASGKGGVGKSNLCVNLAIALARRNLRVTVLDADIGMANADVLCGLRPNARLDAVLDHRSRADSIAVQAPGGFRLVPGAVGVPRLMDLSPEQRSRLLRALADLESSSDLILVDTAAGASPDVTGFLRAADRAIVVTTPEPTAITDAYSLVKCTAYDGAPGSVVRSRRARWFTLLVNQASNAAEGENVHARIAGVARRFLDLDVDSLGYLPLDPAVPAAVRAQTPFALHAPRSPAAMRLPGLADALLRDLGLGGVPQDCPRRGLVAALGAWLSRGPDSLRAGRAAQ